MNVPDFERAIVESSGGLVNRVIVLESCGSTQDEARARCDQRPGLLVMTRSQLNGRGRLGRSWSVAPGLSFAGSLVLPSSVSIPKLSIGSGIAACCACQHAVGESVALGLRWPNDVVERTPSGTGRKVAGLLIESAQGLTVVGIGANILQQAEDFPQELRDSAASLRMLGGRISVEDFAIRLLRELSVAMSSSEAELCERWMRVDVLKGHQATFEHAGRRVTGVVERIDPSSEIALRTRDGIESLPAMTTSLVHGSVQAARPLPIRPVTRS